MIDVAIVAFTTFFVTVGPVDVAVVYAALTPKHTPAARQKMALRATVVATIILLGFALLGETLLSWLGISLPALRTAGGILLLLIGIDMVFARQSGGVSATESETREASGRADISVFPLATPLIAGPGAMGAAILLMAGTSGDTLHQATVLAMLLLVLLLTFLCLLAAVRIQHLLGVTGAQVLTRILGVLLCALAVQFVFDGIAESGILV
ncbi:MarC family protein [Thioalkalivibrio sp.]|uniref:MarC family protein n=1 Tax=Thioalkalivibrio sp. TaxID=2093813 RepID=UPI0012D56DE8|nr:MarC family protein [Thioalkalivibrio sp.]TVP82106.1 MAG: MarC family protein [Thioalkalivibrio sp.]